MKNKIIFFLNFLIIVSISSCSALRERSPASLSEGSYNKIAFIGDLEGNSRDLIKLIDEGSHTDVIRLGNSYLILQIDFLIVKTVVLIKDNGF